MLRLAQVDLGRLRELVTDAWRMRAPDLPAATSSEPVRKEPMVGVLRERSAAK